MGAASKGSNERRGRLDQFVAAIRDRSVLALASVTIMGVTLVVAGWAIQGSAYVPGLLMQLGTAMMLLVPLALLGFMLENRMRRAEEQIRATAAQLSSLTAVTRQRLSEHRQQREETFRAAKITPTQGTIHLLLNEAVELSAITPSGPRVQVPGGSLRLRFRPVGTDVIAHVEEADGTVLGQMAWHAGEPIEIFAEHLAQCLKKLDRYPGDAGFDPTAILQALLNLIQLGIEARTGERPRDLGPLIETPNQQWAVSSDGIFSLKRPYHIAAQRITGSHEDWPRYMRTQAWVDGPAFDEAYQLARQLLQPGGGPTPR